MSDLKPCPFCGGEAALSFGKVICQTNGCGAEVWTLHDEASIERWNRRSQPEATAPAQDLSAAIDKDAKIAAQRARIIELEDQLARSVEHAESGYASPADALSAGDRVDAITDAARSVLREALDAAEVHPCDTNNDSARAKQLSPLMQNLYRAITK